MINKKSSLRGKIEGFKLAIKIVLEILVPVLFCLLALNYVFMREFIGALGISEHTDKIIRINLFVCAASFIIVSAAVINMTRKVISPARNNIGAVLPPLDSEVLDQRTESENSFCSFADSPHEADTAYVTGAKSSLANTSAVRELSIKESKAVCRRT